MRKLLVAVIVVALCAIALFGNALWVDSLTRKAAPRDGGQVIDTQVVPANVTIEGVGPTIVLIHGFGAAIDWWDKITPGLAADHRVIRIDLIGHGGTMAPRSGYSIERQAKLVSALLDRLAVDRFTVIGHSMGGEVATALAEINPQRVERIVLIDSPATGEHGSFSIMTGTYFHSPLGQMLSHVESDDAIRRGLEQGFAPGFTVPDNFIADVKRLTYSAFRQAHDESLAYRKAKAPYERIAALKPMPPLLAIFGTRDAIISPDDAKFFARVPGAKVSMIEGAGHSPMVESPEKVLAVIRDFLHSAN
ncbi:MAG: alpha/beta fold hydrolase [Candidatus Korobacteraceae bacterium]